MKEVYAVIYPVPKTFINSLFESERVVFVKYTTHETISDDLKNCQKLLFYESRGGKKIVGEGNIKDIDILSLEKILEKHRENLFLSEKELRSYSNGRTKKPVVFTLKNTHRYDKEIKSKTPITMGGKYIDKEEYEEILEEE